MFGGGERRRGKGARIGDNCCGLSPPYGRSAQSIYKPEIRTKQRVCVFSGEGEKVEFVIAACQIAVLLLQYGVIFA